MNLLEVPYYLISSSHKKLYESGVLKSHSLPVKILSVGNLTFGGTGKSPMISFLLDRFSKNVKISVLSRGYKRKTKGFYKVNIKSPAAAEKYGDEPCMLAHLHPSTSFYVCEDRVEGVQSILKNEKPDWIFLDDAFQNYKIKKDVNILIVDSTEDLENYKFPPLGRLRSSLDNVVDAQMVFLTKTNMVDEKKLSTVQAYFKNLNMIKFEAYLDGIYSSGGQALSPQDVYLISGIAKPNNFKKSVQDFGCRILAHFAFSDHYEFKAREIDNILKIIGDKVLVTTEKDWVKLKEYNIPNLYVTKLKFKTQDDLKALNDYFT